MENKFAVAEIKGRQLLESFLRQMSGITEFQETLNPYCRVDYIAKSNTGKTILFEVKVRSGYYSTWLLEESKYKGMLEEKKSINGYKVFYCNFYGNKLYLYDIEKCDISDKKSYNCPTQTVTNGNKVSKDCINLNQKDCWIYEYKDNKWSQIQTSQYANNIQTN